MRNDKDPQPTLRLGGELQLKDMTPRSSTVEARELFLRLVLEMRREAVLDLTRLYRHDSIPDPANATEKDLEIAVKLFLYHTKNSHAYTVDLTSLGFAADVRNTPALAFFDYIFRNQSSYDEAWAERKNELKNSSPMFVDEIATYFALQDLIPDWNTLRTLKGAEWLREELTGWADRWHLNNDWCLDFALECVKDIKTSFIDKMTLPENYFSQSGFMSKWEYGRFWSHGRAWSSSLFNYGNSRFKDYFATSEIKDYPAPLNFTWQKEGENGLEDAFSVNEWYNPLVMYRDNYRKKVEEQFFRQFFHHYQYSWMSLLGKIPNLTRGLRAFQKSVEDYISGCEKALKPFTIKTVEKRTGDLHFRWLVEYLIPPVKSHAQIAKEHSIEREAVTQQIQEVSRLLGLKLPVTGTRGRPKGSKDSGDRRRITPNTLIKK